MCLALGKHQCVALKNVHGNPLSRVTLGLGWVPIRTGFLGKFMRAGPMALDASCIVLDNALEPLDRVSHRQRSSRCGAVWLCSNKGGDGDDADDESLHINLELLPPAARHLVFALNSFSGQTFERVQSAYCRLVETGTGLALARHDLAKKGRHTGIVMACLSREATGWRFKAMGAVASCRNAGELPGLAAKLIGPHASYSGEGASRRGIYGGRYNPR